MKHIISWVLRLPSREGVRLTIAPSRPAPPHFEPPPSWGRVRGVGPAAQRGMLAAYLPAIPLQGLIDFQPTHCQALFSSLCCTAWGLKGLFRLGRDEAYKILCLCSNFHSKGKMLYGPDLLWISSSAYIPPAEWKEAICDLLYLFHEGNWSLERVAPLWSYAGLLSYLYFKKILKTHCMARHTYLVLTTFFEVLSSFYR